VNKHLSVSYKQYNLLVTWRWIYTSRESGTQYSQNTVTKDELLCYG